MTLICENICAGFGSITIFENLNCDFSSPHISFIVGENGTGKSLLLAILARLHRLEAGCVRTDIGESAQNQKPPALLMQEPLFFNRSVQENLLFALRAENIEPKSSWQDLVREALQTIGLENYRHVSARKLSGGQKKMLNFARLLLMNRDIWLLDEPTAMLSPLIRDRIETLIIAQRNAGKKIIMVTHEAPQVKRLSANKNDDIIFLYNDPDDPHMRSHYTKHRIDDFFSNPPNNQAKNFIAYYTEQKRVTHDNVF